MKTMLAIVTLIFALGCAVQAQEKPKTERDGKPEMVKQPKSTPPTNRIDTLVARAEMLKMLKNQWEAVKANGERLLQQIQGQIDAYDSLTQDSVWVKKEIFQSR